MTLTQSFILGPFSVDEKGQLSPAREGVAPGFSVHWRGRIVHAQLEQSANLDGRLHLQSSLGRVPSTASDPAARAACLTTLKGLLGALPPHWGARLLPDHQQQLKVQSTVVLPITVTNLVVELTLFLLTLSPYLDLMDRAGVTLVGSRPGLIPVAS
jgi:hypothetical protein